MANLCIPLFSVGKNPSGISWSAHCASTVTLRRYLHRRLSNNGHRLMKPTSKNTCAPMIQKCPTIQLTHLLQDSSLMENMIERERKFTLSHSGKEKWFSRLCWAGIRNPAVSFISWLFQLNVPLCKTQENKISQHLKSYKHGQQQSTPSTFFHSKNEHIWGTSIKTLRKLYQGGPLTLAHPPVSSEPQKSYFRLFPSFCITHHRLWDYFFLLISTRWHQRNQVQIPRRKAALI